jgi:hypothetical protein
MLETKKQKKLALIISAAAVVILGACTGIFFVLRNTSNNATPQYPGPTAEEQAAGDTAKQAIVDEQQKQDSTKSQTPSNTTTVTIGYAGFSDGIADINASAEYYDSGTCTVSFTQGSLSVEKTVQAYLDAHSTTCTNPKVPRSEFAQSGTWSVIVTYKSADGKVSGASSASTITLP